MFLLLCFYFSEKQKEEFRQNVQQIKDKRYTQIYFECCYSVLLNLRLKQEKSGAATIKLINHQLF